MDWNFTYTNKNGKVNYNYENGVIKNIVNHSKLKLWTFFWDQGECESALLRQMSHLLFTDRPNCTAKYIINNLWLYTSSYMDSF